jgi:hypothetical protein
MLSAVRNSSAVVAASSTVGAAAAQPVRLVGALRAVATIWAGWFAALLVLFAVAGAAGTIGAATNRYGGFLWPLWWWDFGWYFNIAHWGYPGGRVGLEYAFFPLWVLVVKASDPISAFVVPGAIAEAATLFAFAGVAAAGPGVNARRTALAIACFPGSFALALVYPDGLALAAAAWAYVLAARGRPLAAAASGIATAASRPIGLLIALPLGAIALRRGGRWWVAAAAPPATALTVHAYFWAQSGSVAAFLDAQDRWGRRGPWAAFSRWRHNVADLVSGHPALAVATLAAAAALLVLVVRLDRRHRPYVLVPAYAGAALLAVFAATTTQTRVQTALAAVALPLAAYLWWMGPRYRVWAVYATAVLASSLASGTLWSFGRHALFAFPLFWVIAEGPRFLRSPPLLAAGFAGNVAFAITLAQFPP